MTSLFWLLSLKVLFSSLLLPTKLRALEANETEIIVGFKRQFDNFNKSCCFKNTDYLRELGVKAVRHYTGALRGLETLSFFSAQEAERALRRLESCAEVEYAQKNWNLNLLTTKKHNKRDFGTKKIPSGSLLDSCITTSYFSRSSTLTSVDSCEFYEEILPIRLINHEPPFLVLPKPQVVSGWKADPLVSKNWGLHKIEAPSVWNTVFGHHGIVVANIDSGIDYIHEDLVDNLWWNPYPGVQDDLIGYDFTHLNGLPYDTYGHGTKTAGILGASGGNGIGTSGVAPHVSIMSLKFTNENGYGTTSAAIQAIQYALQHGAHLINASWHDQGRRRSIDGSVAPNPALKDALERATRADIIVIAASGNDGVNNDGPNASPPATYQIPGLVMVGSVSSKDELSSFSNYGPQLVQIAAPGENILTTNLENSYVFEDGTSLAAPFVTGSLVLMLARAPKLKPIKLLDILMESADRIPALKATISHSRRLNVRRAMEALENRLNSTN